MTDDQLPVDEELEAAAATLVRMGGKAINQAQRFLRGCTDEEITDLAQCLDGARFRAILDRVADRQLAEAAAAADLVAPSDPAPLEEEASAETNDE